MQLINNWFKGNKNYFVGLSLYKTFGTDEALKSLFAKGYNAYNAKRLEEELQKLITAKTLPKPVVKIVASNTETSVMPDSADAVLVSIKAEWMPYYTRMNYLRYELDKHKGNEPEQIAARKPIALEILELEKKCNHLWEKADYYKQLGKLPNVKEVKIVAAEKPVDFAKQLENIKRNIRRNANKLKAEPSNAVYALRHEEYKKTYKELTGEDYNEKN